MLTSDDHGPPVWLLLDTALIVGGAGWSLWRGAQPQPRVTLRRAVGPGPGAEAATPPGWPFVSIIVPARNEARNLPLLLPSLLHQTYPRACYEVIVVDDQSTDATPQILAEAAARDARLRVVRGAPLPPGWKGKPHAMAQGAAAARGDWLLFTDADTVHHPATLVSTVADALAQGADLYTIAPYLVLGGTAERLIMPIAAMGIAAFYNARAVNDPTDPTAIANGQFLLIRRAVYDAVGGVAAVRADIAEDLAFGQLIKRRGYRLYLTDGTALLRVRMYQNLAEVWAGWGKNVLLAMRRQPVLGAGQVVALTLGGVLPFGLLAITAAQAARGRPGAAARLLLCLAQVGSLLALKRQNDARLGLGWGWALTYPVGMALFTLILLNSLRRLLTGQGVMWKGRAYRS